MLKLKLFGQKILEKGLDPSPDQDIFKCSLIFLWVKVENSGSRKINAWIQIQADL